MSQCSGGNRQFVSINFTGKVLGISMSSLRHLILYTVLISVVAGGCTARHIEDTSGKPVIQKASIYPVNENGQTYGLAPLAPSPEFEPDLIAAGGVDGTLGYVLAEDLNGKLPKTIEEALAGQKLRSVTRFRVIPLYASDGKTVVGQFVIGGGSCSTERNYFLGI